MGINELRIRDEDKMVRLSMARLKKKSDSGTGQCKYSVGIPNPPISPKSSGQCAS